MDLSIIIINFNTKDLTEQTINSVVSTITTTSFEIIVVDNSTDKSKQYINEHNYNNVKILHDIENKGFGNACNIGVQNSCGDYILLLNSDTIVHTDTIDNCINYMKNDDSVGIMSCKVLLENGDLDHSCKRGFPTPSASFYYFTKMDKKHPDIKKYCEYTKNYIDKDSVAEVDAVTGAFLIIPRSIYEKINGFDEAFFMYGEDLDLCYRVKELGFKVIYYGRVSITHLKGQSGLHKKSKVVIKYFYDAMSIFYDKHYRKKYNVFVTLAVKTAIKMKYLLTIIKSSGK